MRTFIVILWVCILVACATVLEIRAKSRYDRARRSDPAGYSVTPMDRQAIAYLTGVERNWNCWADIKNGPESETLRLVGKAPSVSNLIGMFNYQMPPFQWFSPLRNRRATEINLAKTEFMPASLDKQWHVSADEHIAYLICNSNMVVLYEDRRSGVRALYYAER